MLEEVEQELDAATARAWQLVKSTEGRLFTVRPDPLRWSAAECLSHLSISTERFVPVLRKAITEAKTSGVASDREPKMDLLGRTLRWFMEPPVRRRVTTAQPFVPKSVRAKADAFGEFSALQSQLSQLIRDARGLDLRKIRIKSPFDQRVRYNLYSAFRIIAAHQRRHLWQAEQAISAIKGRMKV